MVSRAGSLIARGIGPIAAAVRSGDIAPETMKAAAVDAARAHEELNVFVALDEQAEAGKDGPLAGVPFATKNSFDTAALPATAASPALEGYTAPRDAEVIRRLKQAGATLIGTTNMHELSFGVTSNNGAHGPVRNPVHPDYVAGGSSGGSAVAVAIGAATFALAADTGGSSRIPAAFCGMVGFRPSTGRWPDAGLIKVSPTRDTAGVIARTVDDVQRVDAIVAPDDHEASPDSLAVDGLTLGVLETPYLAQSDRPVAETSRSALARLEKAGAHLVALDATEIEQHDIASGFLIAFFEAKEVLSGLAVQLGLSLREFAGRIASPDVRAIIQSMVHEPPSRAAYEDALAARDRLATAYAALQNGVDALVVPCTPVTPPPVGQDDVVRVNGADMPLFPTIVRHTGPASIIGAPSITVPIPVVRRHLPVGLMIEAPPGDDRRLLAVAAAIEAALAEGPAIRSILPA